MKQITKSWQTTAIGALGALGALATAVWAQMDDDPATVADWAKAIPLALGLLGIGITARDHGVDSESAGAK